MKFVLITQNSGVEINWEEKYLVFKDIKLIGMTKEVSECKWEEKKTKDWVLGYFNS